jgi:hypothetical protein
MTLTLDEIRRLSMSQALEKCSRLKDAELKNPAVQQTIAPCLC